MKVSSFFILDLQHLPLLLSLSNFHDFGALFTVCVSELKLYKYSIFISEKGKIEKQQGKGNCNLFFSEGKVN